MVKKVVLAAVLFSAVFSSTCWAMLSFPEENELHCRGCHAPTGAPTADLHHQTNRAKTTGCLGCHPRNADQTLKSTIRDCKACHVNPGTPDPFNGVTYTKGPHHRSLDNSECLLCHNVESILNQPQDPYAGAQDPAPAPIQPELTDETILFPITMSGVPQTTGVPDLLYGLFTPKDCGTCHIPPGDESTANLHHHSERSANSGCTYCHAVDGVMQLPVQRNCLTCHVQPGSVDPFTQETYRYSVHHRTAAATAENCTVCHTDRIIDPPGSGLSAPYAPQSSPNLATPTTSSCRNCHAAIAYGSTTAKLHHAASDNCTLCHSFGEEKSGIRDCESCHTFESLHGINGHTSGTDRCIGCHGDYLADQPPVLEVSLLSREIFTEAPVMNIAGRAFSVTGISSLTINSKPITTDEAGYFSHPQALQPGLNTIIIKAVGNNGKEAIDTRKATLIGVQAEVTITSPADNSVVSTPEIPVEGTSVTMSRIIVKHNKNKEARLIPWRGKFGTRIELQPGLNTIEISSMEKRQMVTRKRTVIYKPTQPDLSVTWPAQDTVTRESTVNIEGNVPEGATITVTKDGVPVATLRAAGRFTVPLSLDEERSHRIEMMAVDVEGRTTKAARNVIFKRK